MKRRRRKGEPWGNGKINNDVIKSRIIIIVISFRFVIHGRTEEQEGEKFRICLSMSELRKQRQNMIYCGKFLSCCFGVEVEEDQVVQHRAAGEGNIVFVMFVFKL